MGQFRKKRFFKWISVVLASAILWILYNCHLQRQIANELVDCGVEIKIVAPSCSPTYATVDTTTLREGVELGNIANLLSKCSNLKRVFLIGDIPSQSFFDTLAQSSSLEDILLQPLPDFREWRGRQLLPNLVSFANLDVVDIWGAIITRESIESLASNKSLRSMQISNSKINSDCFSVLLAMPSLEFVSIVDCDFDLTDLEKAQAKHPEIRVNRHQSQVIPCPSQKKRSVKVGKAQRGQSSLDWVAMDDRNE